MSKKHVHAGHSTLFLSLSLALGLGLVAGLLWLAGAAHARATGGVLYAISGGPASGDCDTWAAACDLQYALDEAGEGDEIWVAQGLYVPSHATLPRSGTFELKAGVALYGGFQGMETSRDQRNWEAYPTVLSGDIDGDDGVDAGGVVTDAANIVGDNVYHVVTANGVTETAELDGFVVTAGKADGGMTYGEGGGLHCYQASPTLHHMTFSGNWARNGGGMHNGAGGWPKLTDVAFVGNWAVLDGGGLRNFNASATLNDVSFRFNSATDGGGMFNSGTPRSELSGGRFVGNEARTGAGGGLLNTAGTVGIHTAISITDSIFVRNTAYDSGGGMALRLGVSPSLVNVGFYGNVVANGGGAGMHNKDASSPSLANVAFIGNSAAKNGGAMHNFGGSNAVLVNVTMVFNECRGPGGGAMWNRNSYPVISNTILGGNVSPDGLQISNTVDSEPLIAYSDVEGAYAGGIWNTSLGSDGGGNMDIKPEFMLAASPGGDGTWGTDDDDYGNVRLKSVSPCIDKGDNASVPLDELDINGDGDTAEKLPYDLDGNPRITGGTVDMGVYEALVSLGLTKKVAGAATGPLDEVELAQGDRLTYTLRFWSGGNLTATGIVLTDIIPASIVDTQVMSAGPTITPVAGTRYVWQIAPLPPGQSGTLTVTGQLSGCVPVDHQVVNTATIWAADLVNVLTHHATATITATNAAPLAFDDAYSTAFGTVLSVTAPGILENDKDLDCDGLVATLVVAPPSGALDLAPDGSFVYTPAPGFAGPVTFTYQASDGELDDQALVAVTVEAQPFYYLFLPVVFKNE